MTNKILFLMDLPSPVHGMSNVNLAVKNSAINNGLSPRVINSTPSYAIALFSTKWWGIMKVLHKILCIFKLLLVSFFNVNGVFYRPINGGIGQIYDIVYLAIARLFRNKIYIHHHSFSYLNNTSRLFSLLNIVAGTNATHIVLGNKMKTMLCDIYNIDQNSVFVISNLAYFDTASTELSTSNTAIKLGHLANLCTEKGVDIFIDVCRTLYEKNIKFSAEIAGPFADLASEKLVLSAVNNIPELHYVGPLYKEQKLAYYKQLDCFIFPSNYTNEAQPLVLFEAAHYGALLLGTQRGCMEDVINNLKGESFDHDANLVNNIVTSIIHAIEQDLFKASKKQERLDSFQNEQVTARNALSVFLQEIGNYGLSRSE